MSLQMYYDNKTITDHSLFGDHHHPKILDIDFQHGFTLAIRNIVWGLGYRSNPRHERRHVTVSLSPIRSP